MSSFEEPEIKKIVEIVLRKRLREHLDDLERRKRAIDQEGERPEAPQGIISRGFLVDGWTESLKNHCTKTLSDLRVLFSIFDDPPSVEIVRKEFKAHVDRISSDLVDRLRSESGVFAGRSSERNRLINLVSTLKLEADRVFDGEAALTAKKQRRFRETSDATARELDDRLPLARRGFFDRDLVEMVRSSKSSKEPLSLVMIDIDHFKAVNDDHGHQTGDEVLMAVAGLITQRLGHKGRAYRYGGEEFAMLLPDYSSEEAAGLAERIRLDIQKAVIGAGKLKVTASFGITSHPDGATDATTLVRKSDQALYAAKQAGRNCVRKNPSFG
jgi:diguanylate cyclase (GGDEF)-like protein